VIRIKWILMEILCLAYMVVLPVVAEAAEIQPQEKMGQYIVYLSEDPQEKGDALTAVPYAEGYYTADSIADVIPFMEEGTVELLARNEELELLEAPNDPALSSQWYLNTLGMDALWDKAYTGEGVKIAVIDSGLFYDHEEFSAATITGHNFLGAGDHPEAYEDDSGHGTLVTAVLAAGRNNGVGGTGLTPKVSVMALRCFSAGSGSANSGNGTLDTVLSAIGWAIANNADVINMSLGGTSTGLQAMEPILQEAADAGILTIAAVGNGGGTALYYPAAFNCVTGVGWTDQNDEVPYKSQHNESVYVSAPGSGIYGPGIQSADSYRSDSGTSFATPMVSAMAVIAKQVDKAIDFVGFQKLLRLCAVDKGTAGWDEYYGHGLINASAFVTALEAPQTITYECDGGNITAATWPTTYQIGHGADITLPDQVTLDGNTFAGWFLNEECTGSPLTSIPAGSVGEVTLYAKWEPNAPALEISGMTVFGIAAQKPGSSEQNAPDWTVLLPKEKQESNLTANDICLSFTNGSSAAPAALTEGANSLWQVLTDNGSQTLEVRYSSYATPALIQSAVNGTAAPASKDGETAAVPFEADLASLFTGTDGDTAFSVEVTAGTGSANIGGGVIRYIPTAADAETAVSLTARAENPDGFSSETASFSITVGQIPVSNSRLVTQSAVYDLNADTGDISAYFLPYGNTLMGVSCGTTQLQMGTDYSLSSQAELDGQIACIFPRSWVLAQGAGDYLLTFTFDNGRTDADKTLTLPLTIKATPVLYTINFYADESLFETVNIESGEALTLPNNIPNKAEHTFDGWYTAQTGGQKAPEGDPVTGDATYYAQWTKSNQTGGGGQSGGGAPSGGGGGGAFAGGGGAPPVKIPEPKAIIISDTIENATVTTDLSFAKSGDVVMITVTPDEGYKVDQVKVTDENGVEIPVTANDDGTYSFEMPDAGVKVEAVIIEDEDISLFSVNFLDVPEDAYYAEAVKWAVKQRITTGMDEMHFAPDDTCTRAQMVTFLWRAAGEPAPTSSENPFTDIGSDAYYYQAVMWAVENGITNGADATHFSPDATVDRGQSVTFLFRFAGGQAERNSAFIDVETDAYYYDAVIWAVENGVSNGTSTTTFSPDADCLRGQIVTFLYRCFAE